MNLKKKLRGNELNGTHRLVQLAQALAVHSYAVGLPVVQVELRDGEEQRDQVEQRRHPAVQGVLKHI